MSLSWHQPSLSRRTLLRSGGIAAGALVAGGLSAPLAEAKGDGTITWWVIAGGVSRNEAIELVAFMPNRLTINVGDTVKWVVEGMAPHTITFLAGGPFPGPADPPPPPTASGAQYSGSTPLSTDNLFPGSVFELTFTAPGEFPYLCLVHSLPNNQVQRAIIQVRPAGSPRPDGAQHPRKLADEAKRELLRKGRRIGVAALVDALKRPTTVFVGVDDARQVTVNRFLPAVRIIRRGETITFQTRSADPALPSAAPHTVTFGPKPSGFDSFLTLPSGDPANYDGSAFLHSGLLWATPPPGLPLPTRTSFTVRFVKSGVFPYVCAIHEEAGQDGKIIVH